MKKKFFSNIATPFIAKAITSYKVMEKNIEKHGKQKPIRRTHS